MPKPTMIEGDTDINFTDLIDSVALGSHAERAPIVPPDSFEDMINSAPLRRPTVNSPSDLEVDPFENLVANIGLGSRNNVSGRRGENVTESPRIDTHQDPISLSDHESEGAGTLPSRGLRERLGQQRDKLRAFVSSIVARNPFTNRQRSEELARGVEDASVSVADATAEVEGAAAEVAGLLIEQSRFSEEQKELLKKRAKQVGAGLAGFGLGVVVSEVIGRNAKNNATTLRTLVATSTIGLGSIVALAKAYGFQRGGRSAQFAGAVDSAQLAGSEVGTEARSKWQEILAKDKDNLFACLNIGFGLGVVTDAVVGALQSTGELPIVNQPEESHQGIMPGIEHDASGNEVKVWDFDGDNKADLISSVDSDGNPVVFADVNSDGVREQVQIVKDLTRFDDGSFDPKGMEITLNGVGYTLDDNLTGWNWNQPDLPAAGVGVDPVAPLGDPKLLDQDRNFNWQKVLPDGSQAQHIDGVADWFHNPDDGYTYIDPNGGDRVPEFRMADNNALQRYEDGNWVNLDINDSSIDDVTRLQIGEAQNRSQLQALTEQVNGTGVSQAGIDLDGNTATEEITVDTNGKTHADINANQIFDEEVEVDSATKDVTYGGIKYHYNQDTNRWNPIGTPQDLDGDGIFESIEATDGNKYMYFQDRDGLVKVSYDQNSGAFVTEDGVRYFQDPNTGMHTTTEPTPPVLDTLDDARAWQEARDKLTFPVHIDPGQETFKLEAGHAMNDVANGLSLVNGQSEPQNLFNLYKANAGLFAQDSSHVDAYNMINRAIAEMPNAGPSTLLPNGATINDTLIHAMNNLNAGQTIQLP